MQIKKSYVKHESKYFFKDDLLLKELFKSIFKKKVIWKISNQRGNGS